MILSVSNISKSFLEKNILRNVSFHLEDYDKAALVGINGVGKTTLLKIIVGQLSADEGIITFSKGASVGYLAQNSEITEDTTIYDCLLQVKESLLLLEKEIRATEKKMKDCREEELATLMNQYASMTEQFERQGGYQYQSELIGVLKGLGFAEDEFQCPIAHLSGGQKTRVALGKLLLSKPDLIILDEPTNHLDMNSISWLENYLLNYKGAVLIVSHDRYFLDKITSKIIELDQTKCTVFSGNYSDYSIKKEYLRSALLHAYLKQQQEIKHQEEVIEKLKSFNREKSVKRAESREKALSKIDRLEKPTEKVSEMKLTLKPQITSGNDVLSVQGLSKSFPGHPLFHDLSFDIKRGEHIAIIGDNGTGKTTLLKIINQLIEADAGTLKLGTNVTIGYYDQEHNVLHKDKSLFQEISDEYPYLTNTQIRNTLAAFLFTGDDVFKLISSLSGGERGRVSLAKLMLSESNFLILDEPTNHLDIMSREILESALNNYEGTILYVSHDRYFINRTATRILELEGNTFTNYIGNYDYYLEKKPEIGIPIQNTSFFGHTSNTSSETAVSASPKKADYKQRKEEQAARRKKEKELNRTEERIQSIEDRIEEIDNLMTLPEYCSNSVKLQELQTEKDSLEEELMEKMENWELLSEEINSYGNTD